MRTLAPFLLLLLLPALARAEVADPLQPPVPETGRIPYAQLSPDERETLAQGEISQGAYIGGGIAGTLVGFGIGNAIQGRYKPLGPVFTFGDSRALGSISGAP